MKTRILILPGLVVATLFLLLPSVAGAWTYTPKSNQDVLGAPQLSADGKYEVTLANVTNKTYGQILFFATGSNKPKWTYTPTAKVFSVAISPNGKYVAAVGSKVWLINAKNGKVLWSTKIGTSVFDAVAFSETGNRLFAGDRYSTLYLFSLTSKNFQRTWKFGSEDGVQSIAPSKDGSKVLVGTKLAVHFVKISATREVWKYRPATHVEAVRLSQDGKKGVATTQKTVYYFVTTSKTPRWQKTVKSTYPLWPSLADNGSTVLIGTDWTSYAYSSTGTELWHFDLSESLYGTVALSGNGKYSLVSQGKDFVYLFDNAYGIGNRPFHIYTTNHARYVATTRAGGTISYGRYDLATATPAPGILADQLGTPVYSSGDTLSVRVFATNPDLKTKNLGVKIALSLPQINWWDQIASSEEAQAQTPVSRSKALQYLAEDLPGYSVVSDQPLTLAGAHSNDTTLNITVPSMLMPKWLEDFLGLLGDLNPLSSLLGDEQEPLEKLTGKQEANTTLGAANEKAIEENLMYPMLGLGTVQLYDKDTGAVYDNDSFYFIYVL